MMTKMICKCVPADEEFGATKGYPPISQLKNLDVYDLPPRIYKALQKAWRAQSSMDNAEKEFQAAIKSIYGKEQYEEWQWSLDQLFRNFMA